MKMERPIPLASLLDVGNGHFVPLIELQHPLDESVKHQLGGYGVCHWRRERKRLVEVERRFGRHDTEASIKETVHRFAGYHRRRVSFYEFARDVHDYSRAAPPKTQKFFKQSFYLVESTSLPNPIYTTYLLAGQ
jgi:hypothetical protein